jgi:hypothetical protein
MVLLVGQVFDRRTFLGVCRIVLIVLDFSPKGCYRSAGEEAVESPSE